MGRRPGSRGGTVAARGAIGFAVGVLLWGGLAALAACEGAPEKPVRDRPTPADEAPEVALDTASEATDTARESIDVTPPDCEADVGAAGCPCAAPADCDSKVCNRTRDGKGSCARPCRKPGDCAATEACALPSSDATDAVCADGFPTACNPCSDAADCANDVPGWPVACDIPAGSAGSAKFCLPACGPGRACPDGMACQDGRDGTSRCEPADAKCFCTPGAAAQGLADLDGCVERFRDGDSDTYGKVGDSRCVCEPVASPFTAASGDDCDDANPDIHPGATETCNGKDDDCSGQTDEGLGLANSTCSRLGVCAADGVAATCPDGTWHCDYSAIAGYEKDEASCDRLDNDCDGSTDEDLDGQAGHCPDQGVCATHPLGSRCVLGQWGCDSSGTPGYEKDLETSCDELDNDCDGRTDEDFTYQDPSGGAPREKDAFCGAGVCDGGVVACAADTSGLTCSTASLAATEVCDGSDNDCDGQFDEGFAYDGVPVFKDATDPAKGRSECTGHGECARVAGLVECTGGQAGCSTNPGGSNHKDVPETCNKMDDDCDGSTDEDLDGGPAIAGECSDQGVCGTGWSSIRMTCALGEWVCGYADVPGWEAGVETTCDGLDNNCDGSTDEAFPIHDPIGSATTVPFGQPCGVGACSGGTVVCGTDQASGRCSTWNQVAIETCNGADDDCDGSADEGFEYVQGSGGTAISLPVGSACSGRGECARTEGVVQCLAPTVADCSTNPGGTGHLDVPETCNAKDDDCDGSTDEGLVLADSNCRVTGVCAPNLVKATCTNGFWLCDYKAVGAVYEAGAEKSCDGLDNDCDGFTDEDFAYIDWDGAQKTKGATCGTGPCANGTVKCRADKTGLECSTWNLAFAESCDGTDNDCDGSTDEEGAILCADSRACTLDSCVAGNCEHHVAGGFCLILGQCYADGAFNPAVPCQHCDAAQDNAGWSPTNIGGACNADGNGCTEGDHCDETGSCIVGTSKDCSSLDTTCQKGTCTSVSATENRCDAVAINEGGACNDGNSCTKSDKCASGTCAGLPYSCNDGLACTTDVCDGAGNCANDVAPGTCVIGAKCWTTNQLNPSNTCQMCQPGTSQYVWTSKLDNDPCSDGDACTLDDRCGGGTCHGGAELNCDDGIVCTADSCNPAAPDSSSACVHTGTTGNACSDGQACTKSDACLNGVCLGEAYTCPPPASCITSSCDGLGGCNYTVNPGFCYIGDVCYANGALKPGQECQYCSPSKDLYGWSKYADLFSCSDGDPCTSGDRCLAGICTPTGTTNCDDGNACTTDTCTQAAGCVHTNNTGGCSDSNACTIGDYCSGGSCIPGVAKSCSALNPDCDPATGICWCGTGTGKIACQSASANQCMGGSCQCGSNLECSGKNPLCIASTGTCACGTSGFVCGDNADTCDVINDLCRCGTGLSCGAKACCNGSCCPLVGQVCDGDICI